MSFWDMCCGIMHIRAISELRWVEAIEPLLC